jgi:trans-2,3-dihydro-3-hydroxyanthranilate isomerase
MTAPLSFSIVDVFAEEPYAGNQLAVVWPAAGLSAGTMQRIAAEFHFSETAFILSDTPRNGGYDVRIFTPGAEVPFAGHPTLGTAHVLRSEVMRESTAKIILHLPVGPIPVEADAVMDGVHWMKQNQPEFGSVFPSETPARVLNLAPDDVDGRFPVEEVSTGLPHVIVPLKTLDALKRCKVDRELYFDWIRDAWAKPVLVFCPQAHKPGNHVSVRMFADCFGIPEDPATGSGNGCLAAYLVRHRYLGNPRIDIRSEQGYEIGRPSLLYLRSGETDGRIEVFVGGRSVTMARGKLD